MRLRPLHVVFIAGAPLALLLAFWLRFHILLPAEVLLPESRSGIEEAARRHAASLGYDASDSPVWVKIQNEPDSRIFSYLHPNPGAVALLRPGFRVETSLRSGSAGLSLTLNPHGHLLGFDIAEEDAAPAPALTEAEVHAAAERFIRQWLSFVPQANLSPVAPGQRGPRNRLSFEVRPAHLPAARFTGFVMMRGSRPVAGHLRPEFDQGFADRYRDSAALATPVRVVGSIIILVFAVYALYLYRKRAREQEAPQSRARLLVLLFALAGGAQIALNFESVADFDAPGDTLPWYISTMAAVGGGLVMALGGVLAGAAYGSGEGEIREGFPGRMTSFDALFAGRLRTRNVAWSVIAGAAAAAWALLAATLAARWFDPRSLLLLDEGLVTAAFGKLPWVSILTGIPLEAAFAIVGGLFMPLTFALRRVRTPWRRWLVLLTCAVLVNLGFGSHVFSSPVRLLESLLAVVLLVAPFFLLDLLAAVTALSLYLLSLHASSLAVLAPWMMSPAILQMGVVTAFLLSLVRPLRRGELLTEDEVKPQHARNLDQRLSMRSEISAAREAQLRLLPSNPPLVSGLSLAASCAPAGDVGADFYDFFPLPGGRLVIFVASGGGLGVASALAIALAKGYLMSDLRRGDPPEVSLARLQRLLSDRLGEAAQRARFALLRIDPSNGLLEVARWGGVPALWRLPDRAGDAQELAFNESAAVLSRTRLVMEPGEALVIHTEGLLSAIEDQSAAGLRHWFASVCPHGMVEAGLLHSLLLRKLRRSKDRPGPHGLRSDLTVVVLRREPAAGARQENVA